MIKYRWPYYMFLAILVAMISLTGCNRISEDRAKAQSYSIDGRLGTTQSNPNLPTSPTYHTYSRDVNMIHQTAMQIAGVKDVTVVLRGADATIHLKLQEDLNIEEAIRVKREAHDAITRAMPRYHIRVIVSKNRP